MTTTKTDDQRFIFADGYQDCPNETDLVGIVVEKALDITDHVLEDGVLVDKTVEKTAERAEAAAAAELAEYGAALDAHLNTEARKLGYDDIKSAVTYADEPAVAKFQDEGKALRAWRSLCYAAGYAALGADPKPTIEGFLSGLPVLTVIYTT